MRSLFGAFQVFGTAVAVVASIATGGWSTPHKAVPAAPDRFAYDQLKIALYFLPGEKAVESPPGSFERDYRWADTQTGDNDHKYATLHHVAYFDGWTRVETAESIQLANLQRRIVIIANKATATFRRYTGAQAEALLAPGRRSQYGTVAALSLNVAPGSAVYAVRDRYSRLPAIRLSGVTAMGQQTVESTVAEDAKGSCAAGRLSLVGHHTISVITEYRAPFAEPSNPPFHLQKTDHQIVDMCHVRVVRTEQPAAARDFESRFLLYKREEDRTVLHDGATVRSVDITERGHVRAWGENDRSILSLPPRYTDECLARPVPSDCEPHATYAKLNATIAFTRAGGGFERILQSRDGSIWFSENAANRLGRIGKDNVVYEITLPAGTMPVNLAETPDGTIWFTEGGFAVVGGRHSGIGSYAPNGTISEPVSFKKGEFVGGIAAANDGNVWFSYGQENGTVSEITRTGAVKSFPLAAGSQPTELRLDSNRNLWVAEFGTGSIANLTPLGHIARFPLNVKDDGPFGLAFGQGRLWFTSSTSIGYLDMDNQLHAFTVPRSDSAADEIIALPNEDAAFSEGSGRIGIVSLRGRFAEFTVPGTPDGLLLDRHGNLWYTDGSNVRMIPDFLRVTQEAIQSL
jgi:virginiamycin B lyase